MKKPNTDRAELQSRRDARKRKAKARAQARRLFRCWIDRPRRIARVVQSPLSLPMAAAASFLTDEAMERLFGPPMGARPEPAAIYGDIYVYRTRR